MGSHDLHGVVFRWLRINEDAPPGMPDRGSQSDPQRKSSHLLKKHGSLTLLCRAALDVDAALERLACIKLRATGEASVRCAGLVHFDTCGRRRLRLLRTIRRRPALMHEALKLGELLSGQPGVGV